MQAHNKYTFESYIPGNNRPAWQTLLKVVNDPGVHTPLCLYGASGCGKTHLLQAAYNSMKSNYPESNIRCVACEFFCNGLIETIEGKTRDLQKQYLENFSKLDCLLMEDVQILVGKKSTTQTLFRIFDALHGLGKQIIFSCNEFPDKLEGLEGSYITKYPKSLMLALQTPDYDTRLKIIESKAEGMNLFLSDDVKEYLAKTIRPDVRAIEGALAVLSAKYQKRTGPVHVWDMDTVKLALSDLV